MRVRFCVALLQNLEALRVLAETQQTRALSIMRRTRPDATLDDLATVAAPRGSRMPSGKALHATKTDLRPPSFGEGGAGGSHAQQVGAAEFPQYALEQVVREARQHREPGRGTRPRHSPPAPGAGNRPQGFVSETMPCQSTSWQLRPGAIWFAGTVFSFLSMSCARRS